LTPTIHNVASPEASQKTRALLADLWRRNRPVIEERIRILASAASENPLTDSLHAAALDVSHKLSGSLGMFGFEQGTILARELEQLLGNPRPDSSRLGEITKQLREMLLPSS
jgi:HPt (histidine-containing phosphotransfer) domain-containing protein